METEKESAVEIMFRKLFRKQKTEDKTMNPKT